MFTVTRTFLRFRLDAAKLTPWKFVVVGRGQIIFDKCQVDLRVFGQWRRLVGDVCSQRYCHTMNMRARPLVKFHPGPRIPVTGWPEESPSLDIKGRRVMSSWLNTLTFNCFLVSER